MAGRWMPAVRALLAAASGLAAGALAAAQTTDAAGAAQALGGSWRMLELRDAEGRGVLRATRLDAPE